ncbi:flavodoxin family protein [Chloroflexota bacterium]
MKALVVYDSFFGNTEKVAQAIGAALAAHGDVEILRAGDLKPEDLVDLTVLAVGSPTRQFRPSGATSEFLKGIPKQGLNGVKVAAFDTRFTEQEIKGTSGVLAFFVGIFGYAAEPISKKLEKKGGDVVMPPEGFYVDGVEGPLQEGELERAAEWAVQILAGH